MTHIAVIILNWNGADMMRRFLPGVVTMTPEAEIWVADNASTDDSMVWLAATCPTVKTIQLDKNYGFAEGYNRAIARIEAEYVVLLNSDVEVTEGWLSRLADFMDGHPDVVAVQPKIRCQWRKTHFEYAGAAGGFIDYLGYPYCRGRIFDTVEEDRGQYDTVVDVDWTTGAAMMVRREAYVKAGGLDASFFAHMEEIDLCWRLRNSGCRLCCVPQSVVYHVGGGTLPQGSPRKTYLNFRNNLWMIRKNHPHPHRVLFMRFWLDVLAMLLFLAKGEPGSAKAVWRAYVESRRSVNCPEGRRGEVTGILSILYQYHIKRNRTWQALSSSR